MSIFASFQDDEGRWNRSHTYSAAQVSEEGKGVKRSLEQNSDDEIMEIPAPPKRAKTIIEIVDLTDD